MENQLHNKILELKDKGLSHRKIANELKCSASTVSVVCKKYRLKNNILLKDLSDDLINEVIKLRKQGNNYEKIKIKVNIKEDQLKFICRAFNLNNGNFYRNPTEDEIEKMQKYYDECKSTRKVSKKFGWSRFTISKYLRINPPNKSNLTPEEYKVKRKQDLVRNVINWRKDKKTKLVEYKGGKCQVCGYDNSLNVLSFHHKDPKEKDFQISSKSYSFERLKKEVDKCIMVCTNCHIEIHEEIQNKGYSDIVNNIN